MKDHARVQGRIKKEGGEKCGGGQEKAVLQQYTEATTAPTHTRTRTHADKRTAFAATRGRTERKERFDKEETRRRETVLQSQRGCEPRQHTHAHTQDHTQVTTPTLKRGGDEACRCPHSREPHTRRERSGSARPDARRGETGRDGPQKKCAREGETTQFKRRERGGGGDGGDDATASDGG